MLDPLPVHAPEELVAVAWAPRSGASTRGIVSSGSTAYRDPQSGVFYRSNVSHALYRAFRQTAGSEVFAFSYAAADLSLSFTGDPVVASDLLVSGNFLSTLGVEVLLAVRSQTRTIDRTPRTVAMLTSSAWRRIFGADPSVIGRTIHLNGSAFTVVGVTKDFYGMSKGGPISNPAMCCFLCRRSRSCTRAPNRARSLPPTVTSGCRRWRG